MPLRIRLIVLPALIVLAGLLGLALYEVQDAKARVRAETQSGVEMGRVLIAGAIAHAAESASVGEGLTLLARDLPPTVRHVHISLQALDARDDPVTAPPGDDGAPGWFRALVGVPPVVERHPVGIQGQRAGTVVLVSQPDDEIAEVWRGWKSEMALIALVSAAIVAVVVAAVGFALRPLRVLADGLERLEAGDFSVRVGPFRDPELGRLGERFNLMVDALEQATGQNRLLINQLMSVQDSERKLIAHELHDEFGPSLFAIRADLGAISRKARAHSPPLKDVEERVKSISGLVEQIQRINSRMLERLRPLVLDQLGLTDALERLVETWAGRYPAITWTTRLDAVRDPGEAESHDLYRAAQECLTNIVRHAEAATVAVSLSEQGGLLVLTVEDDGVGMPKGRPFGFGLLGMAERARAGGGNLTVEAREQGGTRIVVSAARMDEEAAA